MVTPLRNRPASQPMAFLSDIHGNLEALEAVLSELGRRAVVDIFVAGDLLLGGEHPLEVWQRLQQVGARCVQGVSDLALATVDQRRLTPSTAEEKARAERFVRTRDAVGDLVLEQLARLPDRLRLPLIDGRELLLVHGSPSDPHTGMSHDMEDSELRALLGGDPADVVMCGATHVAFGRVVDDVEIVNVGSVGESPEGGFAHFTVFSPKVSGADISQEWVEF